MRLTRPFDYVQLEPEEYQRVSLRPVRNTPNDTVPTELKNDLTKLRRGEMKASDPRWKQYSLSELSFALRRGSITMALHLLNSLLSTHLKVLQDMLGYQKKNY